MSAAAPEISAPAAEASERRPFAGRAIAPAAARPRPVVVISAHTMALAPIRSLGRAGVPVFALYHDGATFARTSRHVRAAFPVPSPATREEDFVRAVLAHGEGLAGALLLPTTDDATAAVARHRAALSRHYLVAAPDWAVARNFIEKRRSYQLAAAAGVPTPATEEVRSSGEAEDAARRLGYPLLVKPSQSHLFYERYRRKMFVIRDRSELLLRVDDALRSGLDVVLQEVVPGPDSAVVNYNAYAWGGRALVEFTARQLRKAPPRFGSPRAARSERIDDLLEPGRRVLQALGFEGFACCEFKRDPRDGRYKILDVNGRPNLSGALAIRCGIDFPLLQYRHLVQGELPRAATFEEGVYWTDVLRDLGYGLRFALQERYRPGEQLAPYLARARCDAILDRRDPRPFLARCRALASSAVRALVPARGR